MFRSFVVKLLAVIIAAPVLLYFFWKFQIIDQLLYPDAIKTWQLPSSSGVIAISPNGEMLATPSGSLTHRRLADNFKAQGRPYVEIRRVSDGSMIRRLDFFSARSLAFSPDNTLIATGGFRGEINLWRISDGQRLYSLSGANAPWLNPIALAFTPDGQTLVALSVYQEPTSFTSKLDQLNVWNVANGKKRYSLTGKYTCAAISPDGQLLALGGGKEPLTLHRISDGTRVRQLLKNLESCFHLNFSSDGKLLAYVSHRRGIPVYRVADGKLVHLLSPNMDGLSHIAISPDGRILAAAYYDVLWLTHTDIFGGPSIQLASHGRIRFWQLDNGQQMQTVRGHKDRVYRLAFHPDGKLLASSGSDATIRFWQVPPPIAPWPWLLLVSSMLIVLSYFGRSYFHKLRQKPNR